MDALGTPFSCIVGLVESLGIINFDLSLGTCKLGPIFDDNIFLPWFNDSPKGNSIVLERESLSLIIKLHGTSPNHELVVYAWFPCVCKCSCMRSTRTPFLTASHELIFRLMGLDHFLSKGRYDLPTNETLKIINITTYCVQHGNKHCEQHDHPIIIWCGRWAR